MNVLEDDWVDVQTTSTVVFPPSTVSESPSSPPQQTQTSRSREAPLTPQQRVKQLEEELEHAKLSLHQQHQSTQHQQLQIRHLESELTITKQHVSKLEHHLSTTQQTLLASKTTVQQQEQQIHNLTTLLVRSSPSTTPPSLSSLLHSFPPSKENRSVTIRRLKRQHRQRPLSNYSYKVLGVAPKSSKRQQTGNHRSSYVSARQPRFTNTRIKTPR